MANSPLLKNEPEKYNQKKTMSATWDDLEGSDSKEVVDVEEAMIYFMAMEDKKDEDSDHKVNNQNLSYDDLFCTFKEMHEDMEKLLTKNNSLKIECSNLSKKNKVLTNKHDLLKMKVNELISSTTTLEEIKTENEKLTN